MSEAEILNIVVLLCGILQGVWIGWNLREKYAEWKLKKIMEIAEEAQSESTKEDDILISIEKHGEVFYVFNKQTDEFMAQGSNVDEVEEALKKRYPNKKFKASEEHLKALGIL